MVMAVQRLFIYVRLRHCLTVELELCYIDFEVRCLKCFLINLSCVLEAKVKFQSS